MTYDVARRAYCDWFVKALAQLIECDGLTDSGPRLDLARVRMAWIHDAREAAALGDVVWLHRVLSTAHVNDLRALGISLAADIEEPVEVPE